MDEKQAVLASWNEIAERNETAVLATVVEVEGSSYRRPGARMLITRTGERIGSISGGCLETDVCQKAWWWTENGAHVQTYDTLTDEEAAQEFGLGCNGVVRILLERVGGPEKSADPLRQFLSDTQRGISSGGAAAIVIQSAQNKKVGDFFLWNLGETGELLPAPCKSENCRAAQAVFASAAKNVIARRKSRTVSCVLESGETVTAFVEFVAPPQPLVVFGGGHDVVPLVRLAKTLGWHVTVVESRPAFARHDRFPEADSVLCHPADANALPFAPDPNAATLLMNHRYGEDCALLRHLLALPNPPAYVGILGPRTRAEKILSELGWPNEKPWPAFLHAPIGLDIGADAPETIALSILAEVQAHLANRNGGKLRERSGPINERQA